MTSLGVPFGHPQAVPERDVHARHADLVHGRDLGRRRPARLGHHRKGLHRAAAQERQRLRGLGAEHVDLARDQVLHDRRAAAIGHELEAGAGLLLEIEQADMRAAAGAHGRRRCLAGICLEPRDQLARRSAAATSFLPTIISGVALMSAHRLQDPAARRATAGYIAPRADMARPVADARACSRPAPPARRGRRRCCAPAPVDVLDDDRLAERCPHALAQNARERVGRVRRRETAR